MPDTRGWLLPAVLGVALITAARVALLALSEADLFVDEAQYWLWGQELAFGYYSKPPMIGWVIRAATEIGSDAPFWVRLPAPLFHAATALILGATAAARFGPRAAVAVALGYATLPMVAVGSLLISTDTIMFPFLALALWGWLRLGERPGAAVAVLTGAALGLAVLSKYAALYYLLGAGLGALFVPALRPSARDAGIAAATALVAVSPNAVWNVRNGLTTLQHTVDNADWVRDPGARAALNPGALVEFLANQFLVFGPVLFAALLVMAVCYRQLPPARRLLLWFALPVVALVSVQALLSEAYANWAAAAYLAGTLAVIPWLMGRRRWLALSFAVNGAFCVLLPLASVFAETLTLGRSEPLLSRYLGRAEMSRAILDAAEARGLGTVVARHRDILADLFHTGRDRDIRIHAVPPEGRPPNHYALTRPYPGGDAPVLLVLPDGEPPACADRADPAGVIAPETGAYRRHPQALWVAPGDCYAAQAASG